MTSTQSPNTIDFESRVRVFKISTQLAENQLNLTCLTINCEPCLISSLSRRGFSLKPVNFNLNLWERHKPSHSDSDSVLATKHKDYWVSSRQTRGLSSNWTQLQVSHADHTGSQTAAGSILSNMGSSWFPSELRSFKWVEEQSYKFSNSKL